MPIATDDNTRVAKLVRRQLETDHKLRALMERRIDLFIAVLDAIDAPKEDLEDDDIEDDRCDLESYLAGADSELEADPGESGIGDEDGLLEQCGELYPYGFASVERVE